MSDDVVYVSDGYNVMVLELETYYFLLYFKQYLCALNLLSILYIEISFIKLLLFRFHFLEHTQK